MAKQRARRGEPALPAATVIIRGDLLDPDMLAETARRNFDVYAFYGISVFAETPEVAWTDLAAVRFSAVPWLVLFTVGDLEAAGLELWDTGQAHALRRGPRGLERAGGSYAGYDTPGGAQPAPHARKVTDAENRFTSRSERGRRRGPLVVSAG